MGMSSLHTHWPCGWQYLIAKGVIMKVVDVSHVNGILKDTPAHREAHVSLRVHVLLRGIYMCANP